MSHHLDFFFPSAFCFSFLDLSSSEFGSPDRKGTIKSKFRIGRTQSTRTEEDLRSTVDALTNQISILNEELLKREQGQKREVSGDGNDEDDVGGVYEMVPDSKQVYLPNPLSFFFFFFLSAL